MCKIKTQFGFSIIELLFIIAVLSVAIAIGVSCVSKEADAAKVQKTALQMQTILQGGIAYYSDHGSWIASQSDCSDDLCKIYLGGAIRNNPWGNEYFYTGTKDNTFKIWSEIPNDARGRVAALLPNAIVSGNQVIINYKNKQQMLYLDAVGTLGKADFGNCDKKKPCTVKLQINEPVASCISGSKLTVLPLMKGVDFVIPFTDFSGVQDPYSVSASNSIDSNQNVTVSLAMPYHKYKNSKKDLSAVNISANYDFLAFCVPNSQ
jgi:type II secretory pathway pseudopilin PulG